MKLISTGLLLLFCVMGAAGEEAAKNPFLTAKVGDWAKYRMSGNPEKKEERFMIKTVETVTELEVVLKIEVESNGKIVISRPQKIPLDKPYFIRTQYETGLVTVNGSGNEKVKAAGKEFETTWTSETIVDFVGEWEMKQEIKIWAAADAPLDGMVKSEGEKTQKTAKFPGTLKQPAQKFQMELVEFGRK